MLSAVQKLPPSHVSISVMSASQRSGTLVNQLTSSNRKISQPALIFVSKGISTGERIFLPMEGHRHLKRTRIQPGCEDLAEDMKKPGCGLAPAWQEAAAEGGLYFWTVQS